MKLTSIEPTVFFTRANGGLRQLMRLRLDNPGAEREASLLFRAPGLEERLPLGRITTGAGSYDAYLSDIREALPVRFELWADGALQDAQELTWQPQRHWELYVVHTCHHDLGYTDLPSNLLREHDGFLDQVIRFCNETAHFPEESRFRYVVEQAWSILHFLENHPPEAVAEAVRLMREGRIEVTALFGNETSELCSHEEQVRLLYPAWRLRRRFGIPIETAELNDIPGISWGLVSVLAGAGIRYFAPMIPDYFRWGFTVHPFWDEQAVLPRDMPGAFWWEGPDGSRVLFWYGGGLNLWDYQYAMGEVRQYLSHLEHGGYPYELVRCRFQGGHRDNSPPDVRLSLVAREWNERWAYPRLLVSTNAAFFRAFEAAYGDGLRVLRGDLPNTDYTVGAASTAKETGVNRLAHETLAAAEKWASFAAAGAGYQYPADTLAEAYDAAMLYDEHTWGMSQCYGPAQEACFSQKRQNAYRAAALAHDVLVKSSNRLVDEIALEDAGQHIVVFNHLSWPRSDVVRALFHLPEPCSRPMYWTAPAGDQPSMMVAGTAMGRNVQHLSASLATEPFDLVAADTGEAVPYQVLPLSGPEQPSPFAAYRVGLVDVDPGHAWELIFQAEDVPSCGYRTYRIVPTQAGRDWPSDLKVADNSLENRYYRLHLDPTSGAIASIWDKELGRELVDAQARFGLNQVVVRAARTGEVLPFYLRQIRPGAAGPLYASLLVYGEAEGCPRVVQEIVLHSNIRRVDCYNRLLRDATPLLETYFAFPFAVEKPRFSFEAPNAVVRPISDQLPGSNTDSYCQQHWVSVANADVAVAWSSLEAPVVTLSELWPGYVSQAHHAATTPQYGHEFLRDPDQLRHGHIYSYALANNFRTNFSPVQVSDSLCRYSFTSRVGSSGQDGVAAFGWGIANPLWPVYSKGPQEGDLPLSTSFCRVDAANVLALTVKAAEDGDGLILRLYECKGCPGAVRVELPYCDIDQAFLTNLAEEDRFVLSHDRHSVSVPIGAYGLATVRLRGQRLPTPSHFVYY